MFSRGLAYALGVGLLVCGLRGATAQAGAGSTSTLAAAKSMDDDFAAVALAVDQCRCPEKVRAKESLAAIHDRMRQDVEALDAAYKARGAADAADAARAPTPPRTGPGPIEAATPGSADGGRLPGEGATRAAAKPSQLISLATPALAVVALLVSAVALFLWWRLRFRDGRAWEQREQALREAITTDIEKMDARIPKVSHAEPAKGTMRGLKSQVQPTKVRTDGRPAGTLAHAQAPAAPIPPTLPKAAKAAKMAEPSVVVRVEPAPPTPEPAEMRVEPVPEQAAGTPRRPSGDPLADYAYAKSLGEEEGEDWFRDNYKSQGLSCVNLNDHRLGTTALYFESDPRGKFLMVEQDGIAGVLPAFGLDFGLARGSLEGVFAYPAELSGVVALARPARVERTGDRWTLAESGEFRRG